MTHEESWKYNLYTGKKNKQTEIVLEEAQTLELLHKDFKSVILHIIQN